MQLDGSIIKEISYGIIIVAICVIIQASMLLSLFYFLKKYFSNINNHFKTLRNFFIVVGVVWSLSLMHLFQVFIWAAVYYILREFEYFYQSFYFSIVTLSTVGYGDFTVHDNWKVFAGMEALIGPLLFGWSASFLFGTVSKFYQIRLYKK